LIAGAKAMLMVERLFNQSINVRKQDPGRQEKGASAGGMLKRS
jgi:hypothetical protein